MTLREQKQPPEYSRQAKKYVINLDKDTRHRVKIGIEKIPAGDIRPYEGHSGYFRLRVGNYRILFRWINDGQILISYIGTRGDVYKKGV